MDTLGLWQRFQKDTLYFGRAVNPSAFEVPSPRLHLEFEQLYLRKHLRHINILSPRHSAKSTYWAGVVPLHHIAIDSMAGFGSRPKPRFILLVTKSLRPHATNLLSDIKDVLGSREWKQLFGDWGENTAKKWNDEEVELWNGTTIMARGLTTQLRGLKKKNLRPSLIVLDDAEDENNTKTKMAIMGNRDTVLSGLVPALAEPYGRIINIGTPQNGLCLVYALKKHPEWVTVHRRAIITDEDGSTRSYWPSLWPLERLEKKRESARVMGRSHGFYREYQCDITGEDTQLVKMEDLRWWDGDIRTHKVQDQWKHTLVIKYRDMQKLAEPEEIPVNLFLGVDPARSTSKYADPSALLAMAVDRSWNRYVVAYKTQRVTSFDLGRLVEAWHKMYKPNRTNVEAVGFQAMLEQFLREEQRLTNVTGSDPKDRKKRSSDGQEFGRLDTLQPFFSTGKMWLKSRGEMQGMDDLVNEILMYPDGESDHLLDALYFANQRAYIPFHTLEDVQYPEKDRARLQGYDWMTGNLI